MTRERGRAWLQLCVLGFALGHTQLAAAADHEPIVKLLRVTAGATCLTAQQLAQEVAPLLDEGPLPSELVFVVEGSAGDPRSVQLRVEREGRVIAERDFDPGPDRCGHLHAAVGLAIALAINSWQEQESARVRDWSLSVAAQWTYRLLPAFSPGAEALLRRRLGEHGLLRAGVLGVIGLDAPLAPRAGTFDAALVALRVDGCARTALATTLRMGGCAGLLVGALYASGAEIMRTTSAVVPWLALAAAADLELELSAQWALALGFSATFLLHRVEVGIEDTRGARVVARALDRLGFALSIGPVYYF